MGQLENKTAIVTGGASGMGRATSIRLAAEGAHVVLGNINLSGAEDTAKTIREAGDEASVFHYDAAREDSCVSLVQSAIDERGQLDVVANVAGIAGFYRLDELTAERLNQFMAVNFTSTVFLCRDAVPYLKQTRGCIINFSSINSRMPVAYHGAYDASKAAVLAFTKSIVQEFIADGVRRNAILPGGFDTPMNANHRFPDDMDFQLIQKLASPLIPMAKADRIAGTVVFLASDDASYINGEQIVVDGGLTSII